MGVEVGGARVGGLEFAADVGEVGLREFLWVGAFGYCDEAELVVEEVAADTLLLNGARVVVKGEGWARTALCVSCLRGWRVARRCV